MRERSLGRVLALAALVGSAQAALPPVPLGRVVWTQQRGREFSIQSYTYLPPGVPRDGVNDGQVKVDAGWFLSDSGTELKADGVLAPESPAATLRFLHPSLDFTGHRFLFVDGASWGPDKVPVEGRPKPQPDQKVQAGSMAIHFGVPGQVWSKPVEEGGTFDAFPVSDTEGRSLYFARFFYKAQKAGDPPGWYLMQRSFEGAAASFVADADGTPVMGYEPCLAASGRHLVFVRTDEENVGSDLWYLPLEPRGKPQLLVHGEGTEARPQVGKDKDFWRLYAKNLGKARISHPTMSGDGAWLAYASDRDGDWDVWVERLAYPEVGVMALDPSVEAVAVGGPWGSDVADDQWPSLAGDGRFLAMASNRADPAGTKTGAEPKIWVAGNPHMGGEIARYFEPLRVQPREGAGHWPHWDQDEDPPHLQIVLKGGDGGDPTVIRIQDEEPDREPGADVAKLSLQLRDHHRDVPPPGAALPPELAPVNLGFPGGEPLLRVRYPTGGEEGNGFRLLLSGKRERYGLHRGFKALTGETGGPLGHRVLTHADFDGLYLWENVRVEVKVTARDNRWLRKTLPPELKDRLYPGGFVPPPALESSDFVGGDPRSLAQPAQPPFFPTIPRSSIQAGYPGICWWIEEGVPGQETDEGLLVSMENAPELLFRVPNDPPQKYPGRAEIFLRVVARDLLGNETDVRIPIHVRGKDFGVGTLESKSERQR